MRKQDKRTNLDSPQHTKDTMIRLCVLMKDQWIRLSIVGLSIILYTILSIYTPFKSAQVIDALWKSIRYSMGHNTAFSITWDSLGKSLFALSVLYIFSWLFYYLQSFLMASVADTLTCTLRQKIAQKLNVLPLRYVNQAGEPLTQASFMINTLQSALASAERTFELLDSEEEIPDPQNPKILEQAEGHIVFDHVSFGYNSDKIIINDFSAKIKQDLIKYGVIPNKTGFAKIPNKLDKRFYPDFIRGYFDGDGSIYEDNAVGLSFVSHNMEILQDILDALEELGVPPVTIHEYNSRKGNYYIRYRTKSALKIYEIFYRNKNCFKLQRKYDKFTEIVQKKKDSTRLRT